MSFNTQCLICLCEDLEESRIFDCGHMMHIQCCKGLSEAVCPVCKKELKLTIEEKCVIQKNKEKYEIDRINDETKELQIQEIERESRKLKKQYANDSNNYGYFNSGLCYCGNYVSVTSFENSLLHSNQVFEGNTIEAGTILGPNINNPSYNYFLQTYLAQNSNISSEMFLDQGWEISEKDYSFLEEENKENPYYNENTYRKAINSGLIDFISMWV